MIIKREALAAVLPAVAAGDTRVSLNCVCVESDGRTVATNGHVLLMATDRAPSPDTDFPIVPGAPFHGSPTGQTLIAAETVKGLIAAMPKRRTLPILHGIQLSTNGSPETVTAAATDLESPRVATVRTDGSHFPAYARVIPPAEQPTTITLAVEVLETLIKAAKAAHGQRKGAAAITFGIPANDKKAGMVLDAVHVSIAGDDVDVIGAMMPFRK